MSTANEVEKFRRSCPRRLRAIRTSQSAATLGNWPAFASYKPSSFDPTSWPLAVRQIWQTLCLAIYEGQRGSVFVPNNLLSLMGDVPRFTEALTGIDEMALKDVALVRAYALCPPGLVDSLPATMSRTAVALVLSRAAQKPTPLLVPVFDADDVDSLRRLSERPHLVGDLRAFAQAGWGQPAQVRMWSVHHSASHGPNTDGAARRFREDIAVRLDCVLPEWFSSPVFGPMAALRRPSGQT